AGAKRKVTKRETPKVISRSAEREEGYAPSTCAHWRGGYGALTRGAQPHKKQPPQKNTKQHQFIFP
ncbi:MAG: hypothetical protein IIV17_03335, partial [Clostridia bacterium]|nr:hypothetical protein [Clostridia bacterium]